MRLYSLSRSACLQRTKYQSKPCCVLMFFSEYSNSICWYLAVPGRNLLLTCRSRSNSSTDFIAYSRSSLAAIIVGAFSCLALAFKRATVSLKKIWKRFIKIYIWPTEKFKNLHIRTQVYSLLIMIHNNHQLGRPVLVLECVDLCIQWCLSRFFLNHPSYVYFCW